MIKVGQIYKEEDSIFVITKIWYNAVEVKNWVDCIYNNGTTDDYSTRFVEKYCKLIAEYPTWQEAVNSKEFKND